MPKVVELRRMAVDSFSRAVAFWDSNNAPVSGARFDTCSVLKKVDRLNFESDIGLHWKSLFLYEFTYCKDNPK